MTFYCILVQCCNPSLSCLRVVAEYFKLRNTVNLVFINLQVWYIIWCSLSENHFLVLLEFINILLSCVHFISSRVISFMNDIIQMMSFI